MTSCRQSKRFAFLLLARASNLPTVWSNCLAGWLLGGAGGWGGLALLCFGASLLYTGGMFLNDAFDARFDRQYRTERPIPSGVVSERSVWIIGSMLLLAGTACLVPFGEFTALFTLLLVACILFYDAVHKHTMLSPLIMAGCRVLLYLVAASTALAGIDGLTIWGAVVLGLYIVGLSYIAKAESAPGPLRYWPCVLLAAPIVVALIANDGASRGTAFVLSAVLGLSTAWSLRHLFGRMVNIGAGVSGLLAGIVLVDALAVANVPWQTLLIFAALFVSARIFQRYIPAT